MSKLDELRAAAMAGKSIADYDHAALARYVTALNPVTVLRMLDVIDAARELRTRMSSEYTPDEERSAAAKLDTAIAWLLR